MNSIERKMFFMFIAINGEATGAQQSILKHHGVTGKVKFTVSVGE